jgi:NAD(P)-dependent dehydrogenase (short-subunit alcohol dehydrogenase family)
MAASQAASEIYVISGARKGIGFELTRQLLTQGHRVYVGVRKPTEATKLKELAASAGGRLKVLELDVTSDASAVAFARAIDSDHIDVLINNAGVYLDSEADAKTVSSEQVLRSIDTNSIGPIRVTQACLGKLSLARAPRVVNISSLMGSIGDNRGGSSAAYRMSKTALNMYTRTLAIDAPKLIVLSLHPGWVKTDMGGPEAPLEVEASARGILNVIHKSTAANSGQFYNYDGRELPW